MGVYKIEDGGTHWIIADDVIEAIRSMCDANEFPVSELDGSGVSVTRLPDSGTIKVRGDDDQYIEKTVAEWIESNGRGPLASTEW